MIGVEEPFKLGVRLRSTQFFYLLFINLILTFAIRTLKFGSHFLFFDHTVEVVSQAFSAIVVSTAKISNGFQFSITIAYFTVESLLTLNYEFLA